MIKTVHIENFKCFENFDIELDPFNVLIGPNDSGKTAFLQAIQLIGRAGFKTRMSSSKLRELFKELNIGSGQQIIWRNKSGNTINIQAKSVATGCKEQGCVIVKSDDGKIFTFQCERPGFQIDNGTDPSAPEREYHWFLQAIGKAGYYRFNPADLRKPSQSSQEMTSTGEGLPTFLEKILRNNPKVFISFAEEFYRMFPYYKLLELPSVEQRNTLRFNTTGGESLPAESVSDGVMLSLAYLALNYALEPPKILLIEEPENGVHHASLKEIIGTLKKLSEDKKVHIILTTHSPYLLDCVEPENVRVFSKDKNGAAHAAKLSDHPEVDSLKKHFMTGEIWTELKEADIVANKGANK